MNFDIPEQAPHAIEHAIAMYLCDLIVSNAEGDLKPEDLEEYCNDRLLMAAEENWFGEKVAEIMKQYLVK